MKRIILLLAIVLVLAACGPSVSSETAVIVPAEPVQSAQTETAVPAAQPTVETESEPAADSIEVAAIPGFPATTVAEASIVRDRDWTQGTADPIVAIIEYGDFQ
jgi:PBP1b-binding outer membrane lipoprotein LpoB